MLLSNIAIHAKNLKTNKQTSILIIEDEDSAGELFARIRVNYQARVEHININDDGWENGIQALVKRHGERSKNLSELPDFNLFKIIPEQGRYVKGFGKAYSFAGETLTGTNMYCHRD